MGSKSDMYTIGMRIKTLRRQRGYSQEDLANDLFDRSYISRIESGKVIPPIETLKVLADRLEVPLSFIIENDSNDWEILRKGRLLLSEGLHSRSASQVRLAWEQLIDGPWCKDLLDAALFLLKVEGPSNNIAVILQRTLNRYYQDTNSNESTPWELMMQLGNTYFHLQQWSYALSVYHDLLRFRPPESVRIRAISNLATTHLCAGHPNIAHELFDSIIDPAKKTDKTVARCYHGIGASLYLLGDLEAAYQYTIKSLEIYKAVDRNKWYEAYHNLGVCLAAMKRFDEAEMKLSTCLAFYRETQNSALMASVFEELGKIAFNKKNYDRALHYCEKGLSLPFDLSSAKSIIGLFQLRNQILLKAKNLHEYNSDYLNRLLNDFLRLIGA